MQLALMIVFFWLGCALLAIAFHPLGSTETGSPTDVWATIQQRVKAQSSAYANG
jgi:hypothetical protein